jgi:hypothetical protein
VINPGSDDVSNNRPNWTGVKPGNCTLGKGSVIGGKPAGTRLDHSPHLQPRLKKSRSVFNPSLGVQLTLKGEFYHFYILLANIQLYDYDTLVDNKVRHVNTSSMITE